MAKVTMVRKDAVGQFLGSARDLGFFDEALALLTGGSKAGGTVGGGKGRKMSPATKAKIAKAAKERWAKAKKDKS